MKKSTLYTAIAATVMIAAVPATASAAIGALNITSGADYICNAGVGTPPDDCSYGTNVTSGSWFGMDGNGNGSISNAEKVRIVSMNTLDFNNLDPATGSHSGSITGKEGVKSDIWEFFGGVGMDYLTSPIVDNGDGTLDMTGWTITWNGIAAIPMGGDTANFAGDTGIGSISCDTAACDVGENYTLTYSAHVPLGDPSGIGGVLYQLNLVGTVALVPVPAAVWLFGSGLLGMVGIARRKSRV